MNPIEALKKAHKAMSITPDDSNLQDYVAANKDKKTKIARMNVTAIEAKFIPSVAMKNPDNRGYRTRFFLADGTTVGTMSNGAYGFFEFFAGIMGHNVRTMPDFLHIDIAGHLAVDIEVVDLGKDATGASKSTYNFDLNEEDSNFQGLSDYRPNWDMITKGFALEAPEEETGANPSDTAADDLPFPEAEPKKK